MHAVLVKKNGVSSSSLDTHAIFYPPRFWVEAQMGRRVHVVYEAVLVGARKNSQWSL